MGTTDRHVALLCHAAGYAPSEVAALLRRPLDDVLGRLARTATRLADARRLGLVPPAPGVDR
jgi:DNA-directed RNA polymerase specialized sigma24 family protein